MQYHNGLSAAKRIGISYKTLLRWIEKGKLKAEHSESGRLLISEEQVEHFRLEIEREKAQFGQSQTPDDRQSEAERDILAKLDALEKRVAELEQAQTARDSHSQSMYSPQPQQALSSHQNDAEDTQKIQPQNRILEPYGEDTLSARDFAAKIGMEYTILDGYTRRGVRGEKMDVTEVPHPTRKGYSNKYFTQEQQEKAIELLRKHGRIE